jgi:dTDP-4-amino-4,6-dideoxygalactose transaminase
MNKIPFNRPLVTGDELAHLQRVLDDGAFSGNGGFSRACAEALEQKTGSPKAIMTASCTDALEMCALILDIKEGDQVIMPSFTFVSTASAFALRGAEIVWCDIREDTKNIDESRVETLVTDRTRAVVAVHYGGVGCEMDTLQDVCRRRGLPLVEDAAQAIDCTYRNTPLGTFGDLATLSFHETKNIQCGEGGALLVNREDLVAPAEIARDKGTDRSRFQKGLVDKYTWVGLGSSFPMSELQAAFLLPQIRQSARITAKRVTLWNTYHRLLRERLGDRLLVVPDHCRHNGHLFAVQCDGKTERDALAVYLRERGMNTCFHYVPLHSAPYWRGKYRDVSLPVTERTSDGLLRLPMFYGLEEHEVETVCEAVLAFFGRREMR